LEGGTLEGGTLEMHHPSAPSPHSYRRCQRASQPPSSRPLGWDGEGFATPPRLHSAPPPSSCARHTRPPHRQRHRRHIRQRSSRRASRRRSSRERCSHPRRPRPARSGVGGRPRTPNRPYNANRHTANRHTANRRYTGSRRHSRRRSISALPHTPPPLTRRGDGRGGGTPPPLPASSTAAPPSRSRSSRSCGS